MSVDLKKLKKLADMCRKAGITHFKNADFEFTLSDATPIKSTRRRGSSTVKQDDVESDSLSKEELLFWSTGVVEDAAKDQ